MKIVVLAGGLSPERDVSLSSGSLIANALLDNGHEVLLW
ncbi:MAG: D-alanine--D-alanine ligase, partial [Clostridiales bacterium]|nr:D-alanine--D-alanine ligase [Clostridiales bacterium]